MNSMQYKRPQCLPSSHGRTPPQSSSCSPSSQTGASTRKLVQRQGMRDEWNMKKSKTPLEHVWCLSPRQRWGRCCGKAPPAPPAARWLPRQRSWCSERQHPAQNGLNNGAPQTHRNRWHPQPCLKCLTSPKMGTVPPQSSSCSSSSQMAASKGKLVQQPPALVAIILTHSRMASTRFSLRVADLGQNTKLVTHKSGFHSFGFRDLAAGRKEGSGRWLRGSPGCWWRSS